MIGVTHIWTVTAQGTEEERRAMLRLMGAGMVDDTHEVDRLRDERDALQARVAELDAREAAMVAATYEAAAAHTDKDSIKDDENGPTLEVAAEAIRAMTPADAKAALDRLINERVQAALAAQGAVTVKPLAWEESVNGRWIGNPPCKLGDLAFWVFLRGFEFGRVTKDGWEYYPSLVAAKAAAQADYERRILAAITTEQNEGGNE